MSAGLPWRLFSAKPIFMRRLTHIMVLAAFVFSCGGQWYALQCLAWVNMIREYSEVVPMTQAISMTFSGQYPCELCKAIAEKKQADTTKALAMEKAEKKFLPPVTVASVQRKTVTFCYLENTSSLSSRTEAPPTPPPRPVLS